MAIREPLKIHFGGQANLFDSGRRQKKQALASAKPDFSSLPEVENLLLAAQKQLLDLPYTIRIDSMEDKLLIWKFKRGSTDAFCRIYAKYKDHLLKISAALVNDKSVAEDVVHDVVIMLAQSGDRIKLTGSLKSFLATCVANRARNVNSHQRLRTACDLDQAEMVISKSPRPEQWIIDNEEFDRLNKALSQLPYEQREVITLHLYGEMKFKAIAGLQQISINTTQSRYRYGIEKLRSLLDCETNK